MLMQGLSMMVGLVSLVACSSAPPPAALGRTAAAGDSNARLLERTSAAATRGRPVTVTLPALRAPAAPQDDATPDTGGEGRMWPVGIGLTTSPTAFLVGTAVDFPVDERLTVGPALQVGLDDHDSIIAPFLQTKYFFDIDAADDDGVAARLHPFAQAGAGVAWVDRPRRSSEVGPLLNFGGGVRYDTGDGAHLGTQLLFNIIPGDAAGESFYVSWEVFQLAFEF